MEKKDLIIVGAGGFGREVLSYALVCQEESNVQWQVKGFLDDDLHSLDGIDTLAYEVIGKIENHKPSEKFVYICAIGDAKIKKRITKELLQAGAKFINLIHPMARVSRTAIMGVGNILCPYACLSANVQIENFVTINAFSGCGHDVKVEDYVTISAHCDITGKAELKEGCFLGSHAVVCPSAIVGEYAKVGAGSVVLKKVRPHTAVFGVPAKKMF